MNTKDTNTNSRLLKGIHCRHHTYTREQKIVMTVWFHERMFTGITFDQLRENFQTRFKTESPSKDSVLKWEKQLFRGGRLTVGRHKFEHRHKTTLARLAQVPYVKESLIRFPDLPLKRRAQFLGICESTLRRILSEDLKIKLDQLKTTHTEKAVSNTSSNLLNDVQKE